MRRLPLIIIGALALLVGAALLFVLTLDAERYRGQIEARASAALGMKVSLAGPIGFKLALAPTISVADVSIANPAWASRDRMVRIERMEITAELLPLLRDGALVIDRLRASGIDLLLEVGRDGKGNWDLAGGDGGGPLPAIREITLERAKLVYSDARETAARRVDIERLALVQPKGEDQATIELKGSALALPLDIAGSLTGGLPMLLAGEPVAFKLGGKALGGGFDLAGEVKGRAGQAKGRVTISEPPGYKLPSPATLVGEVSWTADSVRLQDLKVSTADGTLMATVAGTAGPAQKGLNLTLSVDLRQPGRLIPQFKQLVSAKLDGQLTGAPTRPGLSDLRLRIGESALTGKAVLDLTGATPAIDLQLAGPSLDLRPFYGTAAGKSDRLFDDDPLPFADLPMVNATAQMSVGTIQLRGQTLSDVQATIQLKDGALVVAPAAFTFAQARHSAELRAGPKSTVSVKLAGKGLAMADLLKQLGAPVLIDARGDVDLVLSGQGTSLHDFARTMDGTASLVVGQGTLHQRYVDLLAADLTRLAFPGGGAGESTALQCLVARFAIEKGIAQPKALLLETRNIAITGGGRVDLGEETLDLVADPKPREASLVSLATPFRITGRMLDPKVAPDAEGLVRRAATAAIGLSNPLGWVLALGSSGGSGSLCASAQSDRPAAQQPRNAPAQTPSGPAGIVDQLKRLTPFQ